MTARGATDRERDVNDRHGRNVGYRKSVARIMRSRREENDYA
jgi:hypothetical protein